MSRPAVLFAIIALVPGAARAVDYPSRKPGLWELTMTMGSGRTMTSEQCTDQTTDKDMIMSAGPAQQACKRTELQKTATGFVSDATCTFGNVTRTSHTEVSGDFNSAYTVKVTSHGSSESAMPADTSMTMNAKWVGPCKADQKPGDIIMQGGMKMNVKDMQNMRAPVAPKQ